MISCGGHANATSLTSWERPRRRISVDVRFCGLDTGGVVEDGTHVSEEVLGIKSASPVWVNDQMSDFHATRVLPVILQKSFFAQRESSETFLRQSPTDPSV
jgi:hypothetical protein